MRDISLHILDIVQNSVAADAKNVKIEVIEDKSLDILSVLILDDGVGMTPEVLESVESPFVTMRKTRKVGLGIPLFKAAAESADGEFRISSEAGAYTEVFATFKYSHIDRKPLGDMCQTMISLVSSYENVNFLYIHKANGNEFKLNTAELKEILGDVPFSNPEVYKWLFEYILEGEKSLETEV